MVRVCDAIMGSGKSSAAITYINENPEQKIIYITPYLEEAARIKRECPRARFTEPSAKLDQYNYKKIEHTAALIESGRNIATTHQAFRGYTQEMLDNIREKGYTLIIDESVDVLEVFGMHPGDLKLVVDAGYVSEDNGRYHMTGKEYKGAALREIFRMMKSRNLVSICGVDDDCVLCWEMPPELISSFRDVFILTYLFEGQSIHHFLDIYHIPYEHIGVDRDEDGTYHFCEHAGHTPGYVAHIRDMIHILDYEKMNRIGEDKHALSKTWFDRGGENVEQLKKNVYNYFHNMHGDEPAERRLWGSFTDAFGRLRGKGYTKAFLAFNAKATNNYRDRDCLAYLANIFMNVSEKIFYQTNGVEVDDDAYALSIMVQWIWRSAIRDGREISLYIPSRRMRTLLIDWMDSLSEGGRTDG